MTRHAKRVDGNHSELRDALRALGWDVLDLSAAGCGVPDLVCRLGPGRPHFLELKDESKPPSKQKLTVAQILWKDYAGSITSKVKNLQEAIEALEKARQV